MKGRHHTAEQIVRKLREADRLLGEGKPLVEVCKHLAVTEPTYYRGDVPGGGGFSALSVALSATLKAIVQRSVRRL